MLTKRENLLETIRGGKPDRFVNQYEAFDIIREDPYTLKYPDPNPGELDVKTGWGVTKTWPRDLPGAFPIHDEAHIVCKDIAAWKDYVKAPPAVYPEEAWEAAVRHAESVDRKEKFAMAFIAPGVFEQCHYLLEIQNCMMAFYEEPEAMHELIDYITDWEIQYAEQICKYMKPDGLFHHDDWGSQISTFISPEMFGEFYLPAYKKIYSCYRENGVELIVHHSDSYAATLVPYMIDMGIDIWQGVMTSNNIPELIQKYGPQISFMGGIDSASIDHPGWTKEEVRREVQRACRECGKLYFIPGASQGLPLSTFEGVYEATSEEIDAVSREMF
ncbi:uroporphyrinogen decarboxylase [Lactonifactor longoviformis]|uniref:Uroporphyrinogen decarboxylase (URO-D) n=1 Tax=Lactonifactor longoviformis DSM 17459 TaxID=1122155 RepID=A0A1M5CED9_9CLOT|nr:uroporphyrinogen decarboxylase family protein [Lactonifactor longoviformis]POP31733.1 uroporphyrinogen decarboxylase [Lactonifactor longoviformis]SHF53095.1 Uroporphyrinogen decarboxylase (URO-D) [Lactonifactor longoviformis DSM 17459]